MSSKYKGLTPHNDAKKGDIAKTVLMPGDPLRAKFIAEKYLENPRLVNEVRNMFAYTGTYKGKEITVMGSGMGIPSMGIYSSELYEYYGVENIIRIGSTAATQKNIKIYDIVVAEESITESTFYKATIGKEKEVLYGDSKLIDMMKESSKRLGLENKIHYGKIACGDPFYRDKKAVDVFKKWIQDENVIALEMESVGLYTNAERFNKKALTILSVSDHSLTGEVTTAEERQNSFTDMMELALDVATNL